MAAAYDLARWLMRHPQDAEDAVQESFLKAFRAFDGYAGGDAKAWILAIVRNTCMTRLRRSGSDKNVVVLDDALASFDPAAIEALRDPAPRPDDTISAAEDRKRVHQALWRLPHAYREVLVLREFDDLSYREIADVVGVPAGTVMSRLARARERMRRLLMAAPDGSEKDDHGRRGSG